MLLSRKNQLDFGCCLDTGSEGKLQKIFTSQAALVFVSNRDHPLAQRESVSLVARRDKWISPPVEEFLRLLQKETWI